MFYDHYEYCMSFFLDEVNCLRVLDHAHIDDFIQRRQHWREIAQQRWINGRQNHGLIMTRRWKDITEKTITDLHSLADKLLSTKTKFKLVVSLNQGYIYTNEVDLIAELDLLPELSYKTYTQAVIDRPKDTVQLKKSDFSLRSYFRVVNLTGAQKDQLHDFLNNQGSQIRPGPALLRWLDQPFNRTQDYFFVDHQTQSWLTMLSLVVPGIIRKTMHIITDK